MNLQELVRQHKEISKQIDELETKKKALSQAIMQQMSTKTLQLPGYIVRRCERLSIKLTLEQARSLNAVKIEETVDKDKITYLHHQGHKIDGISIISYIQVTEKLSERSSSL